MNSIKLTPEELYDYLSNVKHPYSSVHEFLCEAIKLRNQDLVDNTIKVALTKEESLVVADMLRFSLEHLTDDFTNDLESYEAEIKLYRKLIKSHI